MFMTFILYLLTQWLSSGPSLFLLVQRHPVLKMSSAIDPLDTPHSDSDSERTLTASFPDYGDSTSARSPDANLLVRTRRTATLATFSFACDVCFIFLRLPRGGAGISDYTGKGAI